MRISKVIDEPFNKELMNGLRNLISDNGNGKRLLEFLETNREVQELISHGNTLAIGRLNYNDHGSTHSRIASTNALTIMKILHDNGIKSTIETELWGNYHDAQVVVLGGTYLHDIGNAVHRDHHHSHTLFLVDPILRGFLSSIYDNKKAHRIRASILECIFSHDEDIECLSIESGCVTIGDGADMANGRARIPFSMGKVDIHSVSALSIKAVRIVPGEKKLVRIEVDMTESAGVFQIQNVLGRKIETSGIQHYIEVQGKVVGEEKRIIKEILS